MPRGPSSSRALVRVTCALAAQGRPTLAPLHAHACLSRFPTSRTCCANGRPLRVAVRLDVGCFLRARWLLDDRRSARWWPAYCRWGAQVGAAGCRKLCATLAGRDAHWLRNLAGARRAVARRWLHAASCAAAASFSWWWRRRRPPLRRSSGDVVTADFF
ncbi:hypothetical protein F511_46139 [Dorcoceras hygrometricum]|uniref:Uncharacterized protein n=1 Tax=Dorcoceras hygrometricum TaxID=472368 RepID=A0A2Z6ZUB5_9LAMI|nr:hypothetical protein F511_46139 [Dorcoceras hygrometricum]